MIIEVMNEDNCEYHISTDDQLWISNDKLRIISSILSLP